jgi:hypothetical protein
MSAKKEYNALLKSGALTELFDDMQGSWEVDEDTFTRYYEANLFFTQNLEVDDYEEL